MNYVWTLVLHCCFHLKMLLAKSNNGKKKLKKKEAVH